ncbi:glycosyltransferase [Maritimibacter sp. UBA3975]|uniref:glycosyltransferase family 2 protein n=1 Tax=Maritimibacter sp. UBA3975 TaxID=1946833 RepID=UPI000C09007F|nr:glycosyltransferase [Maritimibacter sp. UBA3975]MAM63481.1 glycosyl transferase [Maritimibacter sp.]|tara:strand:- start:128839 stop:130086 length:1248 start_codon:yes stop_codon:yes gene_type:complete
MNSVLPVSVVVVSRGRPALLARCLTGLAQLFHPNYEVVVVADPAGCDAVRRIGWHERIKLISFDEANISKARNLGIAASGGEIIAFIDDDAVPEPTWLAHLTAPFSDPNVAQTGGLVLGRNGITLQWPVRAVNDLGQTRTLKMPGESPFVPSLKPAEAIKTEGTNMAVRQSVITAMGGFDPAFAFYLDETDVNRRLMGHATVIVPLAQVHHGFARSERRQANRGPSDLTQIGVSSAAFLRKHAPREQYNLGKDRVVSEQRKRLIGHMVLGTISPDDIRPLMDSLAQGFTMGEALDLAQPHAISASEPFKPFPTNAQGETTWHSGRPWSRRALAQKARGDVAAGQVTTVLRLSPSTLSHRVAFNPDGYWEQWGGLFGRSDRGQPRFRWTGFNRRVREEQERVGKVRNHWADRPISG